MRSRNGDSSTKVVLLIFTGIHYGIGRHILMLQTEQIIVTKVGLIHVRLPYCMLNPRNTLASVAHDTLLFHGTRTYQNVVAL